MSHLSGVKRNPYKVCSLMRSLSKNIATLVNDKNLEKDVKLNENNELSRNTLSVYLNALSK